MHTWQNGNETKESNEGKKGYTYYIPKDVPHSSKLQPGYKDVTLFNQKDRYSILRKLMKL
jgi:hypothetical protein